MFLYVSNRVFLNMSFSYFICSFVFCFSFPGKKEGEDEGELSARYQKTLDALSSLITKRSRFVNNNQSHRFRLLFHYLKVPPNHLYILLCLILIPKVMTSFFMNLFKVLELEDAVSQMKIIHVAGTKGKVHTFYKALTLIMPLVLENYTIIFFCKGSTCTFSESILRNHGLRTGLFTSPHLIDVRERFRLNG